MCYIYMCVCVCVCVYVCVYICLLACSVISDCLRPHRACQSPLPMVFPRQEYWSGLPFPSPGDLPNPGLEPASPALAGRLFTTEPPGKPIYES